MRTLMTTLIAATLSCALLAQQQSPSTGSTQNSQDVPHQEPGTDSPDLGKQRVPAPKQTPGENNPAKKAPGEGTPDVPHQQPGTDSPDLGKQRQPAPGATGTSSKSKHKHKAHKSTTSQTQTSTQ